MRRRVRVRSYLGDHRDQFQDDFSALLSIKTEKSFIMTENEKSDNISSVSIDKPVITQSKPNLKRKIGDYFKKPATVEHEVRQVHEAESQSESCSESSECTTSVTDVETQKETDDQSDPILPPKKKTKWTRKINPSWYKQFQWLESKDERFYCKFCISAGRSNTFTAGKSMATPKVNDLKRHEQYKDHKFALAAHQSKSKDELKKAVSNTHENIKNSIKSLMRIAYFIAKEEIPKEKFSSLASLCRINVSIFFLNFPIFFFSFDLLNLFIL